MMFFHLRNLLRAFAKGVLLACMVTIPVLSFADYPDKPIRMIVGYSPGGAADNLIRPLAERLNRLLGQSIIMEYHPGAGGAIAADILAKAPADGYTLHITDSGPMTIVPRMKKTPYNPMTDFTPLAMVGTGGVILVTPANSPATNVKKLIELMRDKPGSWSYGTSGIGGVGHLAAEQFQVVTNTKLTHIPYKGGAPAIVELIGGHVPLLFSSLGAASAHIQAGRIKPLAVTSIKRSSMFPDVPTLAESGYPNFDASIWFGVVGPAKLPQAVIDKLLPAFTTALQDAAVQEAIRKEGYDLISMTPAQMQKQITQDLDSWGKVIKSANVSYD
jgi:tripartite-type tricarboxylate transporter receptor subunit TctC